jgi:thiol:disulfide interchange protein DsbD
MQNEPFQWGKTTYVRLERCATCPGVLSSIDGWISVQTKLRIIGFVFLWLLGFSARAAHTQASLLLSAETARPGDTILAGIRLRMDPGWHTYWQNSGASGSPTRIEWHLPPGISAQPIQWPVPEKLPDEDLTTYVYSNEVILLVPLKLAANLPGGALQLKANVSWLECAQLCVPGSGEVAASLNVGSETKPSKDAALLETWQKRAPQKNDALSARAWWEKPAQGDTRPLLIQWSSPKDASEADFFPDGNEKFEVQGPTERLPAASGKIELRKQVKKFAGDWPKEVSGVLVQKSSEGRQAYEFKAPTTQEAAQAQSIYKILLLAFVGGLILNIMPCVLPVIALKILGFVGQAKEQPQQVRKLGLLYTTGVLASFLILAFIVVSLKRAGSTIGWGFQFSNPYFLVAMTALVILIALNLFGVFAITPTGGTLSTASALAAKHGRAGAFFNGLLTTVLATSCSAPILATAVGFAFTQNDSVIFLVLLTVGLGLAAPYLVLSWHPAWLRFLPRPGAWMEKFKIIMGFPMLATGVWLCSLVEIYYGERAWWMAMFLVFLAVAVWVYGEFVQRASKHRFLGVAFAALLLGVGYYFAMEREMRWREPNLDGSATKAESETPRGVVWQKWSPEAVAAARAKGQVVVVDFTAKWCPNCNTIVKPTFESSTVQEKIKEVNAAPLLANFTRFPADIAEELKRFDRSGVPLVLVYPRNPDKPAKVFDLVTPSTLSSALDAAAKD